MNPIFVVQHYTAGRLPQISIEGAAIGVNTGAAGSGAFASINSDTNELWVTLNQSFGAAARVEIVPGAASSGQAPPAGCGVGLCGANAAPMLSLTLLGLAGYRMRRRMFLARRWRGQDSSARHQADVGHP
jgi:hypothetical protein